MAAPTGHGSLAGIIWRNDATIRAPVWGDISSSFTIGFHYGIPLAHLLLARQLANMTSLVQESIMQSIPRQKREALLTKIAVVAIPTIGCVLHVSCMDRRFALIEGFGPVPYSVSGPARTAPTMDLHCSAPTAGASP